VLMSFRQEHNCFCTALTALLPPCHPPR
jgi:hypothetical protein